MTNQKLQLDNDAAWLEGVRKIISPNMDDRPEGVEIEMLVIHGISLPPGEFGGEYIDQLFTNTLDKNLHPYFSEISDLCVSSHLLINREGRITQYVPFTRRAWHAGQSEFHGRSSCNDFSIGIELEGCDHIPYTDRQYQTLSQVTCILMHRWKSIIKEHIVGHNQISPGRKTDPGDAFDWGHFFNLLK